MKTPILFMTIILTTLSTAPAFCASPEERAEQSRTLISKFAAELKGYLKTAMKADGPTGAIGVCSKTAPEIAARFSDQTGWRIGRTSLKYRNPDNAPDEWEQGVLHEFHRQNEAGEPAAGMERMEIVEKDGKSYFRYMKAIGTKKVCLTCHGTSLDEEIAREIDRLYPGDRARGFTVGEIRGAFTITQPLDGSLP